MKKILNLLYFILLILSYYLTKNTNMFLLTISFSLLIIYSGIFSTMSIKKRLESLYDKKYYYSMDKIFKGSILLIGIIGLVLAAISYLIGLLLNIKGIFIVSISMCLYLITKEIINIEGEYLSVIKYKKLGNNLNDIYKFVNTILLIIGIILLYKVFNLDNYINISILYLISVVTFIVFNILFYIFIFKKNKYVKKREENKINYIKEVKRILATNRMATTASIIQGSYIYLSIVILYFILINKYNYSYDTVGMYITNIYFYGISVVYIIYKIIENIYEDKFNEIKNKINNKEECNIYNFINKIVMSTMTTTIIMIIVAKPLNNLLFNNQDINIVLNVSYLLLFYVLYITTTKISMICNKEKNVLIVLLVGVLVTLMTSIPLIDASYRMGYNLVGGSLISIILGFSVSTIIYIILINKKLKLSLLDNFNNILNIIYESIIYALFLVLFTFIVKVDINGIIRSILVILFYIFISIMFYIVKEKIIGKRVQ